MARMRQCLAVATLLVVCGSAVAEVVRYQPVVLAGGEACSLQETMAAALEQVEGIIEERVEIQPPNSLLQQIEAIVQTQVDTQVQNAINSTTSVQTQPLRDCVQARLSVTIALSDTFELQECGTELPQFKTLARCDLTTSGGGWTVIQRRQPGGSVNFNRSWAEFVTGFGDLDGEFWYGLNNINCLTTREPVELRIDMRTESGDLISWTYQVFTIAGPEDNYRLSIGEAQGNFPSDAMAFSNGQQFSTFDRDNDASATDCVDVFGGAWWHENCYRANLNGPHKLDPSAPFSRLIWYVVEDSNDDAAYVPFVEMKIRARPQGPR